MDGVLMTMRLSKEGIDTNMLCKFVLHRIVSNMDDSSVITQKRCGGIARNPKINQQPSKSYNFCSNGGKCSKFGLCIGTRYNGLFLRLPGNRRRANNLFLGFLGNRRRAKKNMVGSIAQVESE
jgi:hypothetical protein